MIARRIAGNPDSWADQPEAQPFGASEYQPARQCPLLAQSRHEPSHRTCPLLGV